MSEAAQAMKPSRYNGIARAEDGTVYAHNLLRGTTFKVAPQLYQALSWLQKDHQSRELTDALPKPVSDKLYDLGFLVDADCDETAIIKKRFNEAVFASDTLELIVLTTLWCNFDCPYCFETKRADAMSDVVKKHLETWVAEQFKLKRFIHVGWFGGEPLLEKQCLRDLSASFQRICDRIGASYQASITTNGFYLDKSFSSELDALTIRHVQITLDGNREYHDKYRSQRNGRGSFDRIYQNINDFFDVTTNAKLAVRVNCTDDNLQSVEELISAFPVQVRNRTTIFFRWVWSNIASGNKEFSSKMRGKEPFARLAQMYDLAADAGWIVRNPIRSKNPVYCEVDFRDHYTIAPDGDIFLCTHRFDPGERIGSLLNLDQHKQPIDQKQKSRIARWLATDCFSDQECLQCKVLPICKGGCRKERSEGRRGCIEEKHSLDRYIFNQARAAGLLPPQAAGEAL